MKFILKATFKATAVEVYSSWLSSEGHTNMTGGEASISDTIGTEFSAWDGYISGKNISLEPHSKITQSWRTTEFNESEPDSILEILLQESDNHTELTLSHSKLPETGGNYKTGWEEHYFQPMRIYFTSKR